MSSLHFHPLRVSAVRPETADSVTISFEVPEDLRQAFTWQPGQYLTLRKLIGDEDVRRSYSICAGPDEPELRIGVRKVEGGVFSTWANEALKAGDSIEVIEPQGHFVSQASDKPGRHVVGLAAGSGITPILSIMKSVLTREPEGRFTLIYGNRNTASTMFKEEIEDLKNRYMSRLSLHHVFSREHMDSPLSSGRLDQDKLATFFAALVPLSQVDEAFVCGPHGFNDDAHAALLAGGLKEDRIKVERFGVPDAKPGQLPEHKVQAGDAVHARIAIIRDGLRRDVDFTESDPSVLDAASRAGLDVPYSCKSGVCSTCRAKVLEGKVRMDRNHALDKAEVAQGFVLACQAHPLTEKVVLSFDER
ncbi:1,2-phenylacetyl-CoA epoxidase subunit PaaE [Hydrogenophaga sp. 5NK40-0174]|uniref:1,2-phenylacetyl-CoA epoxidase subunit PaaE n=1 Tax=Hydrogenophaga sp. 5NK40-0174 TaxID=3127649 RepID=UPI00333FB613